MGFIKEDNPNVWGRRMKNIFKCSGTTDWKAELVCIKWWRVNENIRNCTNVTERNNFGKYLFKGMQMGNKVSETWPLLEAAGNRVTDE